MIERARTGYVVRGSAITERRKKKRTIGATVVGSLGCALARLGQDDYGLRSNRSRRTIAGLAS